MEKITKLVFLSIFALATIFVSCKSLKKSVSNFNLYAVSDDIALGKQVSQEIEKNPKDYPLLPEQGNEKLYAYVRGIVSKLLKSNNIENESAFKWSVKIINDNKTLNAFCTPGGYIYVYTGLLKFLDSENQLAGVLGHEMAHAARRHSTRQMTTMFGIQMLTDFASQKLGQKEAKQVVDGIIGLKFSRDHETEADNYSVAYLCPTDYKADGAAGFFKKIKNQSSPPEFLSTHPNPENRIEKIEAAAKVCKGTKTHADEYQKMKALIK